MQILIPDSWLREYLHTNATPKDIQRCLSLCGPSIERLHEKNSEYIYDIEVTTNRVDCMSVYGIAREAAAILPTFGFEATLISDPFKQKKSLSVKQKVNYLHTSVDSMLCPNFTAVLVKNIHVEPSPDWLVKKLELVGIRSLNNVVDSTNYLTHDLGQPVHVFDYDKISKQKMTLRASKSGEKVTTLDNQTCTLTGGDIIIEDGENNIIDLSGIMGAKNSSVSDTTKNILLFVQNYEPIHIRKTSMNLAHRTTAAVLFEKGLTIDSVLPTLNKGLQLIKQLAGGTAENDILEITTEEKNERELKLTTPLTNFTNSRLGINLTQSKIKTILKSLGFIMKSETVITIPWYRKLDIEIAEDLVEEIARMYGYHNLPTELMSGHLPTNRDDSEFFWVSKIKSALKHWGFTECYTYSLVNQDDGLKLKNPLTSDWAYLRTSLTKSHQEVIDQNLGRVPELNLFEIANVYLPRENDLPDEKMHLIVTSSNKNVSKLKGVITALFHGELNMPESFYEKINWSESKNCIMFEIDLSKQLVNLKSNKTFTPISKFAPIIEDINIHLNKPYPELEKDIKATSHLIKSIEVVDRYGSKITLRLSFLSDEKQLSAEDIAPIRKLLPIV